MINKKYRHVFRSAALALLVALAAACGKDTPIDPATDNGRGTPIAIGQLRIASTADANADATWKNGDAILVSATPASATPDATRATRADATPDAPATPLTAVYTYTGDGSWKPADGKNPLYVEHISPTDPIIIESWGGDASPGTTADGTPVDNAYTDQSTADRYHRNDHLQCPIATLTARTLHGELTHRRVDFVLNITDGPNGALNALPHDAVLKLNDAANASGASQEVITAYREDKTANGTTTFRALIKLKDVPGISLSGNTGGGNSGSNSGSTTEPSGTVSDGRHLLGTLAYTMPASDGTRSNGAGSNGTHKTLKIYYSITSGTDANGSPITPGSPVLIKAGKRITVSATFVDLSHLDATASLEPWTDIKAGDAGTGDMNMVKKTDETTGNVFYEIYSAQGLKKFADLVNGTGDYDASSKNPSANAKLMTNIDLSTVCGATKGDWVPIGTDESNPYLGCFDGQGHTVSGLYIKGKTTEYTGLFGCIGKNGNTPASSILHLRVKANEMNSNNAYNGVLAGCNYGTFTDCYAMGDITGGNYNGGLVGYNGGNIATCYATGKVSGRTNNGGLVGRNYGNITACYATGKVSGTSTFTGGLVGYNGSGNITACYATGSVSGMDYTGGLAGYNNNATITACYATGSVLETGSDNGGLVEENHGMLFYCATMQSNIYRTNSKPEFVTGTQSNVRSFSDIRATVAHDAAQAAWGSSIDTNGLVQSNESGRILNGPWNGTPAASPTAIWKSPVDGTDPTDQITGGSLHLWWQPNP